MKPGICSILLFAGLSILFAGCRSPVGPESDGGTTDGPPGYAQRHQDFSRRSVHLLGAIEGVQFAERHQLAETRREFLKAAEEAADALLDRHGGFPPHPSALNDPDRITHWQDAMARARATIQAIEKARKQDSEALQAVTDLLEAYRAAGHQSGYPAGTIAFLEWRGVHKMARDLEPELRLRFVDDVVLRLERGRENFVAERRPLMPEEELPEFDRRVRLLLDQQVESVRKPSSIPDSTAYTLHQHYPFFHRPDVLAKLLTRGKQR